MPYRPKTRVMPEAEYEALANKIYRGVAPLTTGWAASTKVFMCDSDFVPTQTLADVRWIMTDNPYDMRLFQVDAAGDAILLTRGD